MDEKKALAVLPVKSMGAKENKSQFPTLAVQGVLVWALFVAFNVAFAIVFAYICCAAAIKSPELDLMPVQVAEVDRFEEGFLWLTVPQAGAATVGLLLPPHRRRSLASVALACAVVAHYMHARAVLVLIAAIPEDVVYRVMAGGVAVFMLAGDLLGFLFLLMGRGAE